MQGTTRPLEWVAVGDLNAYFALLVDNLVNLVVLSSILVGVFHMPAGFVATRMIPGTALGVMFGDLMYTWMAARLGPRATAMPLGLDTPSTIGMAVAVIGPAYASSGDPATAWYTGMAALFLMGVTKIVLSFVGDIVIRGTPRAGLLGPLAGVGLALLGLFPVTKVFAEPLAGFVALSLVLFGLVARRRLPWGLPSALFAVICGIVIHFSSQALGLSVAPTPGAQVELTWALPLPQFAGLLQGLPLAVNYLPVAIPFGLLTVVGGINVTESARAAGDDYRTRDILLVEALATVLAAIFGGVAQSTPYIGHPAYKGMGARAGYTLGVGLTIGIAGVSGLLGPLVEALPEVVVAPILLFVGVEIAVQAFEAVPQRHHSAVAMSIVPVLAYLCQVYMGQLLPRIEPGALDPHLMASVETITVLGNGFILTAMLWGALVSFVVDGRATATLVASLTLAVFTMFGVVHSTAAGGAAFVPWASTDPKTYYVAAGYAAMGGLLWVFIRLEGHGCVIRPRAHRVSTR